MLRWIGVTADDVSYPTSRARSQGFELGEPITDEIPNPPYSYWKGRKSEPR